LTSWVTAEAADPVVKRPIRLLKTGTHYRPCVDFGHARIEKLICPPCSLDGRIENILCYAWPVQIIRHKSSKSQSEVIGHAVKAPRPELLCDGIPARLFAVQHAGKFRAPLTIELERKVQRER
jgi:hypothetical protein